MKKTYFPSLLILVLFLSSCFGYNEYLVESDYSYYGKFNSYKTFNFMSSALNESDSSMQNDVVENAIRIRLQQQGYRLNENKPNLLVSYKLFYKNFDFNGYNQPDINDWVRRENESEKYNPITYSLREGTILVLLFDRKKEKSVWQGYASGLFGDEENPQVEKNLKRAVRSILDRYQFLAEGFADNEKSLDEYSLPPNNLRQKK